MRLHLVALPHTRVEPSFCGCAYTAKALKFCKMMGARHEIFLYAPEGPPVKGATLIPCLSEAQRTTTFGADDPARLPNWPTDAESLLFNRTAAKAIQERAQPRDLVLFTGGRTHLPIAEELPNMMHCEPGVGYEGVFTDKCAFESYAWMHHVYAKGGFADIRWFDCVIPPYCDPDEFPHLNEGKGDYLLFLGRLISRKGPHIAQQIAKAAGLPLKVAGAGGRMEGGKLLGLDITIDGEGVDYVGPVDVQERGKLLAGARALLVPTTYCEPGGNVAIEAMLAGTPVIAPDWGVYSETVMNGVSGFHFRMFQEAVDAVRKSPHLTPRTIRNYALGRYSLDAVGPLYDAWLNRIVALFGAGWYAGPDEPRTPVNQS